MGGRTDKKDREDWNGSCPTHGWEGKHELFGDLKEENVASGQTY